jgi:hypothetical protein
MERCVQLIREWCRGRVDGWVVAFAIAVVASVTAIQPWEDPPDVRVAPFRVVASGDSGKAVLQGMSRRLAAARTFTVDVVLRVDGGPAGRGGIRDSTLVHIEVMRPDRVHAVSRTPGQERHFYFDGRGVTVYDATKNIYATAPVRGTIDDMVHALDEHFGFVPPLAEFLANDPWFFVSARMDHASLDGVQPMDRRQCRRVSMRGGPARATLSVAADDGLPCELTTRFTHGEGTSRLRVTFSAWNLGARVAGAGFVFRPRSDTRRVPMMFMPAAEQGR